MCEERRSNSAFSVHGGWCSIPSPPTNQAVPDSAHAIPNPCPEPWAHEMWDFIPNIVQTWQQNDPKYVWVVSSATALHPVRGEDNGCWLQAAARSWHMASVPRTWQCCHQRGEPELCEQPQLRPWGKRAERPQRTSRAHCRGWAGESGGLPAPNLLVCWCTSIWMRASLLSRK